MRGSPDLAVSTLVRTLNPLTLSQENFKERKLGLTSRPCSCSRDSRASEEGEEGKNRKQISFPEPPRQAPSTLSPHALPSAGPDQAGPETNLRCRPGAGRKDSGQASMENSRQNQPFYSKSGHRGVEGEAGINTEWRGHRGGGRPGRSTSCSRTHTSVFYSSHSRICRWGSGCLASLASGAGAWAAGRKGE